MCVLCAILFHSVLRTYEALRWNEGSRESDWLSPLAFERKGTDRGAVSGVTLTSYESYANDRVAWSRLE